MVPFPESYWVIPDKLPAGEHPCRPILDIAHPPRLQSLLDLGIQVFIDLTEGPDYSSLMADLDFSQNGKPLYVQFPIIDYTSPGKDHMVTILNTIDTAICDGKKVYVHCFAGQGRTGTVVGCYLARHGITGKASLERIKHLRKGLSGDSPETDRQKNLVLNWPEGI
jgi:protein-tyrosine phosphatase